MRTKEIIKKGIQFFELRRSWLGAGGQPVPSEQAQRRADVCLTCPHNVPKGLTELFTEGVALTVKRQIQMKSQMQMDVTREEELHICDKCLCVLKLKVHAPLKFILENGIPDDLPEFCWQKIEQKQQAKGIK